MASLREWLESEAPAAKYSRAGVLILLFAGVLSYFTYRLMTETILTPCSPGQLPARCYEVAPSICETAWASSESSCKTAIAKLALPPGRLTSPLLKQCQLLNFDRLFGPSRRSDEECTQLHQELKEWGQRNEF